MKPIQLSKQEAREFQARAHWLDGPKLKRGKASLRKILKRFQTVQVDSIDVCGTNQEIFFSSRIDGFVPDDLYDALYGKKPVGFEYWSKAMCILPVESKPFYEPLMKRIRKRDSDYLKKNKKVVNYIKSALKKNGPMLVTEFEDMGRCEGYWSNDVKVIKHILDILWGMGEVMICGRKARQRCFNLTENQMPWTKPLKSIEEYKEKVIKDRISSMRLTRKKGNVGETWHGISEFRNEYFEVMEDSGYAIPVEVEGSRFRYLITKGDRKYLNKGPIKDKQVRLIAPLDSFIWDRPVVEEIFDFEAKFEVYTPAKKRRWGYYCLSVLFGADLVGRVDLARDRKKGVLEAKNLHWEPKFKPSTELLTKLADELRNHANLTGMSGVKVLKAGKLEKSKLQKLLK